MKKSAADSGGMQVRAKAGFAGHSVKVELRV